jgi:hypothetical protein
MQLAIVVLTTSMFLLSAAAQVQLSDENAYNPIPSPDAKNIAAVRTGWSRPGGSGGWGRSNLVSEIIILDREGHTLSSKPLSDGFIADWTKAGIVSFRSWSYSLISAGGSVLQQGPVCPGQIRVGPPPKCAERVAYLPKANAFVWVFQKFGDSVLLTPDKELSSHHHQNFLGDWLVPSPDEKYIAVGPRYLRESSLNIYDIREKTWIDLGTVTIHPDRGWDWMEPSWNPWFADSSQLAFFTTEGLVVSSPDGRQKRVVLRTEEPAGLAVPSPDGRAIAYATFKSRPRNSVRGSWPIWGCTGIWVVGLQGPSQPRRLVGQTSESTFDLRWLDNDHLVFERIAEQAPPKARLWTVAEDR